MSLSSNFSASLSLDRETEYERDLKIKIRCKLVTLVFSKTAAAWSRLLKLNGIKLGLLVLVPS